MHHHAVIMDGSTSLTNDTNTALMTPNGLAHQPQIVGAAEVHNGTAQSFPPLYDVAVTYDTAPPTQMALPNQCEEKYENKNQNNSSRSL